MPRFNVILTVTAPVSANIEVSARTSREAAEKAVELVLTSRDYTLTDFDGNSVEIVRDDVTVDGVEKA